MVTSLKPLLAVSVPETSSLGPEVPRPVCSRFLADSQPLQPHFRPWHPIPAWPLCPGYIQSLITLVIFPSMLVELMGKAN